jgi:multidrug efflux pump
VIGGMLAATVIAIFFIPMFYYLIERMFGEKDNAQKAAKPPALTQAPTIPDGAAQNRHEGD